jgi:hypothetical protein
MVWASDVAVRLIIRRVQSEDLDWLGQFPCGVQYANSNFTSIE